MNALEAILQLQQRMRESVRGQEQPIREILIGLLADGHVLLEGLPGLAKTRAVKSLAQNLDARMSRIQFTPDLLPSDITGSEILYQEGGRNLFRFQTGPIFGNLILADEINRAPAKVQSALLEAMEERQITVAGSSHALPPLFMVLATQNPIEQEGTYPLPEAQMDRFLLKITIDYPDPDAECAVLELVRAEQAERVAETPGQNPSAGAAEATALRQDIVFDARREIQRVAVAPAIDRYIVDLINATRHADRYDAELERWLQVGASPRGGIALERCARANAWLDGRDYVTPEDVRAVAHPALRHRLILSYDARADGIGGDAVIDRALERVALPA